MLNFFFGLTLKAYKSSGFENNIQIQHQFELKILTMHPKIHLRSLKTVGDKGAEPLVTKRTRPPIFC